MHLKSLCFLLHLLLLGQAAFAQEKVNIYKGSPLTIQDYYIFNEESNSLNIDSAKKINFLSPTENNINQLSQSTIWAKFNVKNLSDTDTLYIIVRNPILENITFYTISNGIVKDSALMGSNFRFSSRLINSTDYIYPVHLLRNNVAKIYIKVRSNTAVHLPISVLNYNHVINNNNNNSFAVGLYIGIVLIMFLYNFFLFFATKDESYLYYIVYLFAIGFAQIILNGYTFKTLWPNNSWLAINSINISGIFSGIATVVFCQQFLRTKVFTPRIHQIFNYITIGYIIALIIHLNGSRFVAFNIINLVALTGSFFAIYSGYIILKKNYRPAKFFLVAFTIFLTSVIVYVLRTTSIIPYNFLTAYILEIGSVLQMTLLSLALADKINTYRNERAVAKNEALRISRENEILIKQQNVMLEEQVQARTAELQQTNHSLNQTLTELKTTQTKLVDSEKMASLGQLTAGIAHEINNPINFVASNIKPLQLDIDDLFDILDRYNKIDTQQNLEAQLGQIQAYKNEIDFDYIGEEIKTLLSGIKEGASRTAEIVKNLKNFARVDQANMKLVDLNEGLQSTIMLVRNSFPTNLSVHSSLEDLPLVECIPGKINQVYMNIITNGVQAMKPKEYTNNEEPTLTLRSWKEEEMVKVSIKDNGIGMSEATVAKMYDPFFTTKDVGEGTGLGMSIVKGIIESHNGTLEVKSTPGIGTEFILTLPIKQS